MSLNLFIFLNTFFINVKFYIFSHIIYNVISKKICYIISSLVFCREAGSWLPYSPLFPVFCLSLYFRIRRFFQKLVQHTQSFPSPWSFSYHPTLYHLPQKAFASEYMTNPIFLPSPDHIHKTSFFLYYL